MNWTCQSGLKLQDLFDKNMLGGIRLMKSGYWSIFGLLVCVSVMIVIPLLIGMSIGVMYFVDVVLLAFGLCGFILFFSISWILKEKVEFVVKSQHESSDGKVWFVVENDMKHVYAFSDVCYSFRCPEKNSLLGSLVFSGLVKSPKVEIRIGANKNPNRHLSDEAYEELRALRSFATNPKS